MKIMTWNTFKKKHKPEMRQVQDGSLGIIYTIEPTMRHAGFRQILFPVEYASHGNPLGFDYTKGSPRQQVTEYVKNNPDFKDYKECVYNVWHVRQEYGTVMIDLFFK